MAYNFGRGAAGAGTGALTGFAAGGPIGAAIGGGLGLLGGLDGNQSSTAARNIQTGTPQQQQLQNRSNELALAILNGQGALNPIGQQAIQRFNTQTVPGLAERFTAMGGGPNSSSFQGSLGQAGAQLNTDLASQQYSVLGLLGGLGRGDNLYEPEEPGFDRNLLNLLFQIAPQLFGNMGGLGGGQNNIQNNGVKGYSPPYQTGGFQHLLNQAGYQLGGAPLPPAAP
jgi:hypothetical protein